MSFSTTDLKKLREETGARVMDCKKALDEAQGDYNKAKQLVEAKGLARAEQNADRETKIGYVASYIHNNGTVGSLVEILCETDFVAANEEFKQMAKDIAMQVAAMNPADVAELLAQEFIKDPEKTIDTLVKSISGKIGEKMVINRFTRFAIGES